MKYIIFLLFYFWISRFREGGNVLWLYSEIEIDFEIGLWRGSLGSRILSLSFFFNWGRIFFFML